MWRSIAATSKQLARNFGVTRNPDKYGFGFTRGVLMKVLETPFLGDNLIRFFKWAIKEPDINVTTDVVDVLVRAICGDLRKKDAYALWDLIMEVAKKDNVVLNGDA
ncbi:hypothetical protein GH714_000266 [Hevea brasiliensis]|uniref:Uncharacterized protein n=1 Tax=Hevea brasiliensis TaxID=3981 RepID=A0A6A6KV22_HEVBR|nr:hypothetical protein GH714_000266 [Hevea brasiliensis]